ncbi:hypothetical protein, partial [Phenylobacterium sp.]|uniref:hypothetical protein n=1 Tax=Phenylobacterium sp. TaxID=1871053 RepID=UPI0039276B15
MAQRKHWSAEALGQVSNSTTTWANVVTLNVPADEQTAGAAYVLFWSVELQSPSQVQDVMVRVVVNGVAGAEGRFDSAETMSPVDYSAPGGFVIFSAGETPAAATFQLQYRSEAAGVACLAKRARLTLLALASLDAHVENLGRQTTNVRWSTAMQTAATLTFTPSSAGDYLILASALIDVAGFSVCEGYFDLYDGAEASPRQGVYKRADTDVVPVVAMWRRDGISGLQQVRFRWAADNHSSTAPTVGISEVRIVALHLDRFDSAHSALLSVSSEGADAADVDALTLSGMVSASPHLALAAWTTIGSNSPEETAFASFVDNGTLVGEVVREPTSSIPYNNNGGWPAFVHRAVTYEAGARTWKLRRRSEATSISRMYAGAMIAVLDLGLPRAEARGLAAGTSTAQARARAFHGRAGRAAGAATATGRRGWF